MSISAGLHAAPPAPRTVPAAGATPLARPSSLAAPADGVARLALELDATASRLWSQGDRRALFFTMYSRCVNRIAVEMQAGAFQSPGDVAAVVGGLGRRALDGLGAARGSWARAGELADTGSPDARVLGAGMNAHLTVDLPHAIAAAGVGPSFGADLQRVGHVLVDETERIRLAPGDDAQRRLVEAYADVPLVPAFERAFNTTALRDVAYSVILHEATAQARLLGRVPAAHFVLNVAAAHRERVMDAWLSRGRLPRERG